LDTITQITLGAAVGEAVLGKKAGNKAAAIGAVFGVVPDLDVLASPFVTDLQDIAIHRGITHSVLFSLVVPVIAGWFLYRSYRKHKPYVSWLHWSLMIFLVLVTHIFIDVCTSYGTQVFQPFSNYSLSFNSIFIIDPFYTVPLLAGILAALILNRESGFRPVANYLGLTVSTLYLVGGFLIKAHVNSVFKVNFRKNSLPVERYMTTPAPFSVFLWTGYAEARDTIHVGLYSIFDDDRDIQFQEVPKRTQLIRPYQGQRPVERLEWFSNGYYSVSRQSDGIYFHDLRFGRSDLWLTRQNAPFVWNYLLHFNRDSTRVTGVNHKEPSFDLRGEMFGAFLDRVWGKEM